MQSGYTIYDYHRAVLFKVKQEATATLDGDVIENKRLKGRISFFKRLSVSKGNVAATFEDIIIAVTPNVQKGIVGAISPPYQDSEICVNLKSGVNIQERKEKRMKSDWMGYSSNLLNIGNLGDKKRKAKPS